MKRKRRKYLWPGEHPGSNPAHPAVAEALRKARPGLFIVWGMSLAGYLCGGFVRGDGGGGLIGVAISAGCGYLLWQALVTGYVSSNHGSFFRAAQPFRYWVSVAVLALGYTLVLAVLFLGGTAPGHDAHP
jgi:hypothetical protein